MAYTHAHDHAIIHVHAIIGIHTCSCSLYNSCSRYNWHTHMLWMFVSITSSYSQFFKIEHALEHEWGQRGKLVIEEVPAHVTRKVKGCHVGHTCVILHVYARSKNWCSHYFIFCKRTHTRTSNVSETYVAEGYPLTTNWWQQNKNMHSTSTRIICILHM